MFPIANSYLGEVSPILLVEFACFFGGNKSPARWCRSDISPINHSETGVMFTNLAIERGHHLVATPAWICVIHHPYLPPNSPPRWLLLRLRPASPRLITRPSSAERIMELPCSSSSWLVHVSLSVDPIGLLENSCWGYMYCICVYWKAQCIQEHVQQVQTCHYTNQTNLWTGEGTKQERGFYQRCSMYGIYSNQVWHQQFHVYIHYYTYIYIYTHVGISRYIHHKSNRLPRNNNKFHHIQDGAPERNRKVGWK